MREVIRGEAREKQEWLMKGFAFCPPGEQRHFCGHISVLDRSCWQLS